jgi:hypothetical protein
MMVFENRVLRRIFGSKTDAVTGQWRRLYNGVFMFYTPHQILSVNKIKKNKMDGACITYDREERCIQGFGWKN